MREIEQIYESTHKQFKEWSFNSSLNYRNAVCAETLRANQTNWGEVGSSEIGDKVGFSILWTSIFKRPQILLCGCCVTSFGSYEENVKNLAGEIPNKNLAIGAKHQFGQTIERVFRECNSFDLLKNSVGMNMWHFQYVGSPTYSQFAEEVRLFCESNTVKIIELLQPKYLISLHNYTTRRLRRHFPELIEMPHPSFQSGTPFKVKMSEFLQGTA